jgi:xanthine/CO dehydrogenase XdhC/CoxF family maturation factor
MRENVHVVRAIEEVKRAGKQAVLATVVRVFGSAYRREGAKMVTDEDGCVTGMISGGCLEADVAEVAKTVMEQGMPVLKRYALDRPRLGSGTGLSGYRRSVYRIRAGRGSCCSLLPFDCLAGVSRGGGSRCAHPQS